MTTTIFWLAVLAQVYFYGRFAATWVHLVLTKHGHTDDWILAACIQSKGVAKFLPGNYLVLGIASTIIAVTVRG